MLRDSFSEIRLSADTAITMHYGRSKGGQCWPPCHAEADAREGRRERGKERRREREEKAEEEKETHGNRIFNHGLSVAVASQSFTIAQERRRGKRIRGGEGKGDKQERGKKIRA